MGYFEGKGRGAENIFFSFDEQRNRDTDNTEFSYDKLFRTGDVLCVCVCVCVCVLFK